MNIEITVLIAVVGCFVGLAGWLSGRDKKRFPVKANGAAVWMQNWMRSWGSNRT